MHDYVAAGFALSLLGGAWSGWLGRGFPVFAWCIVGFALLLGVVVTARLLVQVHRAACAAGGRRLRGTRLALIAGAIIATGISGWTLTQRLSPGENLLGDHDQGMYLGAAVHLARTGQFRIDLPALDALPPEIRENLLQRSPVQYTRGDESERTAWTGIAPGFPLANQPAASGPAVPHFPAGTATYFGAAFAVAGWPLLKVMNWWATGIGILSLGLVAARRFGPGAGFVSVALLALHPLLSWAANRYYAEPLLFALWATGLSVLACAAENRFRAGLVAGLCFAVAATVKFDAVIVLLAVSAGVLFSRTNRATTAGLCTGGMTALATGGFLMVLQAHAYVSGNIRALLSNPSIGAAVAGLFVAFSLLVYLRWSQRHHGLQRLWWLLILGAGIAALYLYLIRPDPLVPDTYSHAGLGREIRSWREETLRRLDWYWLPFSLLPTLVGAVAMGRRFRTPAIAALLIAGIATLVVFGYDLFCEPRQPYAMRRLAVFTIPFLVLGIASLASLRPRRWFAGVVALFVGGQAVAEDLAYRRLDDVPEYAGSVDFCARLAARLPPDAIVLVPHRSPFAALAMAIRLVNGREVWIVQVHKGDAANTAQVRTMISGWVTQGTRVMVLTGGGLEPAFASFTAVTIARERWQTSWQPGSHTDVAAPLRTLDTMGHVIELLPPGDSRSP